MNFRVDGKVDVGEILQLKGSVCPRGLENASIEYVHWEGEWIFFSPAFLKIFTLLFVSIKKRMMGLWFLERGVNEENRVFMSLPEGICLPRNLTLDL